MTTERKGDYYTLFLTKNDVIFRIKYGEKVYKILEKAYRDCGGINITNEFKNVNSMITSIFLWRLTFSKNGIQSITMFKKNLNKIKMVAYTFTDTTNENLKKDDITFIMNKSYGEYSGRLHNYVIKVLGNQSRKYFLVPNLLEKEIIIKYEDNTLRKECKEWLKKLEEKGQLAILRPYIYKRKLGKIFKCKMLMGTFLGPEDFILVF